MTKREYYENAYATNFEAQVVSRLEVGERQGLILSHTFFYPTSGGQPNDLGTIGDARVIDVFVREQDEVIVHVVDAAVTADHVHATIDWDRRFDHMQQHTGQHILSRAFIDVASAETTAFHLGDVACTIDLHTAHVSAAQLEEIEMLANAVLWENRPVRPVFATRQQVQAMALRSRFPIDREEVRLITIEEFDTTPCGGTHVSSTGEIGLIKIVRTSRRGEELRVEFLCGRRALSDYEEKNRVIARLSSQLTTGVAELPDAVERLQTESKEARRLAKRQQNRLLSLEAASLLNDGEELNSHILVVKLFEDREPAELRSLANQIARASNAVALLGLAGAAAHLVFAQGATAVGKMDELLSIALPILGEARGGGKGQFAQGGGPAAKPDRVQEALERAKQRFLEMLGPATPQE